MSHHYQSSTLQTFDCGPQRPVHYSLWHTLSRNFHWRCLLTTILIHSCISYATWCHVHHSAYEGNSSIFTQPSGPCSQGYSFLPLSLGFLLYAVYLSECWTYRVKLLALPKRSATEARALLRRMRNAIPIVWWKSLSYHYTRRTRYLTRYRNGNAVRMAQVYYERVNSHSAGNVFLYDSCGCRDISRQLVALERHHLVRMRISKGFVFANVQAADEFEEQRTRFFTDNEAHDDYMEVREGLDLADVPFVDHMLVFSSATTRKSKPLQSRASSCLHSRDDRDGRGRAGGRRRARRASSSESDENSESAGEINSDEDEEVDPVDREYHRRRERGLRPVITSPNAQIQKPWYVSAVAYWVASIFLLSWPVRMWTEWHTAHVHYHVTKLFGTNYLSPSSPNYTGPLTRSFTMDSARGGDELELMGEEGGLLRARNSNYVIVPSYSEAILLDPLPATTAASITSRFLATMRNEMSPWRRGNSRGAADSSVLNSAEATRVLNPNNGHPTICYGAIEQPTIGSLPLDGGESGNVAAVMRVRDIAGSLWANLSPWRRGSRGYRNLDYQQLAAYDHGTATASHLQRRKRIPRRSQSMLSFLMGGSEAMAPPPTLHPAQPIPPQRVLAVNGNRIQPSLASVARSISISGDISTAATVAGLRDSNNNCGGCQHHRHNHHSHSQNQQQRLSTIIDEAMLTSTTSSSYTTTNDRQPLLQDRPQVSGCSYRSYSTNVPIAINEPPPSYEAALRICAPIYQRIRPLASSISSLLNAIGGTGQTSHDELSEMHSGATVVLGRRGSGRDTSTITCAEDGSVATTTNTPNSLP